MSSYLEVESISKRFGATVALESVSARFEAGQIHCLLGENGAGKSTLGKIIGGVAVQDSGRVLLDGRELALGTVARARAAGIAVVFQELSMIADLSVRANVMLGTEAPRRPWSRLRRELERTRIAKVLERLELNLDMESRAGSLPVATQQLLEVAKALVREPRMIVFDEPTAMLGEHEKLKLYGVLRALRAHGATIVLVTHHLEDVEAVADQVTLLRDGRRVDAFASRGLDAKALAVRLQRAHASQPARTLPADAGVVGSVAPRARSGAAVAASAAGAVVAEVTGLRDRGGGATRLVLRAGEITALYGVIGCGAEAVVSALTGVRRAVVSVDAPALGTVIDGVARRVTSVHIARDFGIAYLPTGRARNGILPGRSLRENLNVGVLDRHARFGVVSPARERAATERALREGGVKFRRIEDDMRSLSGGNQQKILIARALAAAHRLLVLEDPTAGVDLAAKRQIMDAIRARVAQGLSVMLVSSDLTETLELAQSIHTFFAGAWMRCHVTPTAADRAAIVADVVGHVAVPV